MPFSRYKRSPFALSIERLETKALTQKKLIERKKDSSKECRFALEMLDALLRSLDLLKTITSKFDKGSIPDTLTILALTPTMALNRRLLNKKELAKQFGTRYYSIFVLMRKFALEHASKGQTAMLAKLLKSKDKISTEVNHTAGTGDAADHFDAIYQLIEEINYTKPDELKASLKELERKIISNKAITQFQITDEYLVPVIVDFIENVRALPLELPMLMPFLNPKALEFTESRGVWRDLLAKVFPEYKKCEFIHRTTEDESQVSFRYDWNEPGKPPQPHNLDEYYLKNVRPWIEDFLLGILEEYHLRVPFDASSPEKILLDMQAERHSFLMEYARLQARKLESMKYEFVQKFDAHVCSMKHITDIATLKQVEQRLSELERDDLILRRMKMASVGELSKAFPELENKRKRLEEKGHHFLEQPLPNILIKFVEDNRYHLLPIAHCGDGFILCMPPSSFAVHSIDTHLAYAPLLKAQAALNASLAKDREHLNLLRETFGEKVSEVSTSNDDHKDSSAESSQQSSSSEGDRPLNEGDKVALSSLSMGSRSIRERKHSRLIELLTPLRSKQAELVRRHHRFMNVPLTSEASKQLKGLIDNLIIEFDSYLASELPEAEASANLRQACYKCLASRHNEVFQTHRDLFAVFKNILAALARFFNSVNFQTDTYLRVNEFTKSFNYVCRADRTMAHH